MSDQHLDSHLQKGGTDTFILYRKKKSPVLILYNNLKSFDKIFSNTHRQTYYTHVHSVTQCESVKDSAINACSH